MAVADAATSTARPSSEERCRALIEASASACWYAGPDGVIFEISGWGAFPQSQMGTLTGHKWLDEVHPDDRERVAAEWSKAVKKAHRFVSEYRIRVGGRYIWVQARAVAFREPKGAVREWVGTIANIEERKRAEDEARVTAERFRLAARATQDAIWDWELRTGRVSWGEGAGALFGYAPADIVGTLAWWESRIHPEDRKRVIDSVKATLRGAGETWNAEYRFERNDGGYADVLDRGFITRNASGRATRMVGAMQDLTARKHAEAAVRDSEERLRLAIRAGRMVPWKLHVPTQYVTRGETSREILGLSSGPLDEFLDRVDEADLPKLRAVLSGAGLDPFGSTEFRFHNQSGDVIWLGARIERLSADEVAGVVFDITQRKKVEEEAWYAANHDPLTGLANRTLLKTSAQKALDDAADQNTSISILLIDLDDFRDINDTLGHDVGDAILKESARRLSRMVHEADTVARVGGDEFAIVLAEQPDPKGALAFAERVLAALRAPFSYQGMRHTITASIGVALFPEHDSKLDELSKDADLALYRAKDIGRDRAVVYSPALRHASQNRYHVIADVRDALDSGTIVPFYQPKISLQTGRIVGFEALARWLHPSRGVLTPGHFQQAFDHPDLSRRIGAAITKQTLGNMRQWSDSGLDVGRVAVNFCSAEFAQPDLAESLLSQLHAANIPTSLFEVEVTETVFLGRNSEQTAATLKKLHEAGVHIALDDFGTGFASLSHLKQFPVDHIKIDQSFIRNLMEDEDDRAIVRAVIGLGKSLNLSVTAEGVETPEQENRLRLKGCDFAQGYLYAKPMAGAHIPWFVKNWKPRGAPAVAAVKPSETKKRRA